MKEIIKDFLPIIALLTAVFLLVMFIGACVADDAIFVEITKDGYWEIHESHEWTIGYDTIAAGRGHDNLMKTMNELLEKGK